MISFSVYKQLYGEAKEYDNIDMYIMERGWQDWMDDMTADDIADLLRNIYTISRDGIKGLLSITGDNLTVFCRKYVIKYRTAQNWLSGNRDAKREAPEYTLMLLGFAVLSDISTKTAEE